MTKEIVEAVGVLEREVREEVAQVARDPLTGREGDSPGTVDDQSQPVRREPVDGQQLDVRLGGGEPLLDVVSVGVGLHRIKKKGGL